METVAGVSWGTTPAAAAGVPGVGVTAAPAGGAGVTGQAVVLGVVTVALLLAVAATAWTVKTRSRWAGNGLMVLLCAELGWGWVLAAVHGAPAERPAVWAWAGATLVLVVVAAGVARLMGDDLPGADGRGWVHLSSVVAAVAACGLGAAAVVLAGWRGVPSAGPGWPADAGWWAELLHVLGWVGVVAWVYVVGSFLRYLRLIRASRSRPATPPGGPDADADAAATPPGGPDADTATTPPGGGDPAGAREAGTGGDVDAVVVLGAAILGDRVSRLLAGRCDRGREAWEELGRRPLIIVSGGQGDDEVCTEASVMRRYLVDRGVPEDSVVEEGTATDTGENIDRSLDILNGRGIGEPVIVVCTSDFHVPRTERIVGVVGARRPVRARVVGCTTARSSRPAAYLREFVALSVHRVAGKA
ncbi:YdcF family protein [Corynebacterium bovis]|uniref:YdcF family protein n=1 Tax=Corynebacterium bovis TaxID=36808 RepID=UPI002448BE2A|nr:YdcF family protein [Corynebacterium bovis]MDH2455542.1 YdcF family protein [Corynebacterium bovis]